MKTFRRVLPLLLFLFFLPLQVCSAEDIAVDVSGFGADRELAMRDLKRNAVEEGIGVYIDSKTVVKNFAVESDKIKSHAEGFVKKINQIFIDEKGPDGLWQVKAKVIVSLDSIKNEMVAIRMLLDDAEMPRIMVLMNESIDDRQVATNPTSETEFIKLLTKKRFHIIDPAEANRFRGKEIEKLALAGNTEAVGRLGQEANADILIVGTATSKSQKVLRGSNILSNQVTVNVKVIRTSTGALIFATTKEAVVPHISALTGGAQGIAKASREILNNELLDQIMIYMMDEFNNGMLIKVRLKGLTSYSRYNAMKQFLEGTKGVVSVNKRFWNKETGMAEFDVMYRGTPDLLAEGSDGQSVKGSLVEVDDLTANTLDLLLR